MGELGLAREDAIRLGVFLAVLGTMMVGELAAPRRRQEAPRLIRWPNNLALVALDMAVLRLLFPILAVGLALRAEAQG